MTPCALLPSLRLRAVLSRRPCLYPRLLPVGPRSFASAPRLWEDKKPQAAHEHEAQREDNKNTCASKKRTKKDGAEPTADAIEDRSEHAATPKRSRRVRRARAKAERKEGLRIPNVPSKAKEEPKQEPGAKAKKKKKTAVADKSSSQAENASPQGMTLKQALLGAKTKSKRKDEAEDLEQLDIKVLTPEELDFQAVDVEVPPVPMLSYGLDRVLFNPGVYRLQDPRSRVYNFDPYLEKIMPVNEFDFSALSEYKTSSKDEELLALTQRMQTKFTGSTSSMSGVLQHFHFLLSNFRPLNHEMLSRKFPNPTPKFSKITQGPSAIFLRKKEDVYAIDADKMYDQPNIMSWLGHSLEKLLTVERQEFERYRRSSPEDAPSEDQSARCYHYSKLGNFLMRSQLDAHDPRLPGSGVFDLKTRAVVSIRMNHKEYEKGSGYQLRYDCGEWESFEREFYDMTRATMLKYSLQVRMGRMDGIFVAYHNIERIFGFQYLSISDMDNVLHGQTDTCLGDQEFKLSIRLLDELMQKATEKFPDTTLHLHFHTHKSSRGNPPFMYIFAEPVTEEQADAMQNKLIEAHKAFERDVVGVKRDDPQIQAEWHDIQDRVNDEVNGIDDEPEVEEEEEGIEQAGEVDHQVPTESNANVIEEVQESSQEGDENHKVPPSGPLMAWTLAVRHKLNGAYVDRPQDLEPQDTWTIEYHVRELKEEDRWGLYEKVKAKRNELIGEEREKNRAQMVKYLKVIKTFSNKGRKWREEQDALAAEEEQQVYQPLGPGSQVQTGKTL